METFNIENLTIGQLCQLAPLVAQFCPPTTTAQPSAHPFSGRVVLCRCTAAGVHVGTLQAVDGDKVQLTSSRRLWYWKAKAGLALSGVAQHGLHKDSKLDAENPNIWLSGVCEIIPLSEVAKEVLRAF